MLPTGPTTSLRSSCKRWLPTFISGDNSIKKMSIFWSNRFGGRSVYNSNAVYLICHKLRFPNIFALFRLGTVRNFKRPMVKQVQGLGIQDWNESENYDKVFLFDKIFKYDTETCTKEKTNPSFYIGIFCQYPFPCFKWGIKLKRILCQSKWNFMLMTAAL